MQWQPKIGVFPAVADQYELAATAGDTPILMKIAANSASGTIKFDKASPTVFTIPSGAILEFLLPPDTELYVASGTVSAISVLQLPPSPD